VISTHILEEVDAVCSPAIIISDGRLLADDTPRGPRGTLALDGAVTLRLAPGIDLEGRARRPAATRRNRRGGSGESRRRHQRSTRPGALLPVVTELVRREGLERRRGARRARAGSTRCSARSPAAATGRGALHA
jgi:ABC-type multidrug transport system ATPase subunit